MGFRILLLLLLPGIIIAGDDETESEESRKILGSSVVTSVSVIMDTGNGSKAVFTDAVGKPMSKPAAAGHLASPINLLNPDRYEFYTFDDSGDLVKRLMTLHEIQQIIANGDGDGMTYNSDSAVEYSPEKKVDDIVNNVQNVLKEEIQKNSERPVLEDLSSSWTMVLPAVFGNSGEEVVPDGNLIVATPETIMIEPTSEILTTNSQESSSAVTKGNTISDDKTKLESVSLITTSPASAIANKGGEVTTGNTDSAFSSENATSTPFERLSTFVPIISSLDSTVPTLNDSLVSLLVPTSTLSVSSIANQLINTSPTSFTVDDQTVQTTTGILKEGSQFLLSSPSSSELVGEILNQTESSTDVSTQTSPSYSSLIFASENQMQVITENQPASAVPLIQDLETVSSSVPAATTQRPLETYTSTVPIIKDTTLLPVTQTTIKEAAITEFVAPTSQEPTTTKVTEQNLTMESTKTPISAEDFPSSTYSFLTTFFGMNALQNVTSTKTETTTPTNDKLSQQQQENTEPSTIGTLDIEKLAVTELLDQLLLSSTNIYQLNSEFGQDERFDSQDAPAESKTESDEIVTTLKPEVSTKLEQLPTQQSVISSIEQLLSQAMADVEEPAENSTQQGEKVHEFMMNMGEKNMSDMQEQTATVMSSLMGNLDVDLIKQQNEEITNRNIFTNISDVTEEPPLDKSVDSFISQVVLEEVFNATTIVDDLPAVTTTTQKNSDATIEVLLPKIEEEMELNLPTTTETSQTERLSTTQRPISNEDEEEGTATITNDILQDLSSTSIDKIERETAQPDLTTVTDSPTTDAQRLTTVSDFTTTTIDDFTTDQTTDEVTEAETIQSNIKWAPVSTIAPSTSLATEKIASIITNPTTPFVQSVDLSSQISAGFGLEDTTTQLDTDIYQFVQLCNELAFSFWKSTAGSLSPSRSLVVSPFAATSLLAMVFLGARGATSGEMNEILRLDDMVTFNPHLIFRNVTESIEVSRKAGVAASAIVRELYSDKSKGKLLNFYKERARQFYDGHVEEVNFKEIGDIIRRRTNLLVKRYTWSKIHEFIKENSIKVRPPLAGVSVNIFQTDCSAASTSNRDGEIYFQVSPTIRQRRLVPIPAAVWRSGFLAGYEPGLDATAVAIGTKEQLISTIFVMPGQQGIAAPGDGLIRLEQHLVEGAFKDGSWIRLLKSLIPRTGLEVQIPRFYHKSFVNATSALQKMGLKDLFDFKKADLRGLNGVSHELYLSDIVQINNFATCGEGRIDETHHIETYPSLGAAKSTRKLRATEESEKQLDEGAASESPRDYHRAVDNPLFDPDYLAMPLPLRPRQARVPDVPKLRFDRPFLYFVRHNPTGLIMHMGRFNPRLLP